MRHAQEARERARIALHGETVKVRNLIVAAIEKAVESGQMSTSVNVYKTREDIVALLVEELKALDYKVKRNQGYDQRDGDSWDTLSITW